MNINKCPNCQSEIKAGTQMCPHCGYVYPFATDMLEDGRLLQDRYEIQRLIHNGGMGYIYLAQDKRLDRECIVKQVRLPVKSEAHRKKLEEEALRMAQLSHPAVAMVLDHFVEDDFYFLIVEYIHGKTLAEIYEEKGGNMEEGQVISWMQQVCGVVGYLHQTGMVHRDISPDNIMLTEEGRIKLIDFGTLHDLSMIADKKVGKEGKFGFTPKEQWDGHPVPQSDVFAIAATTYYLLTGYLPISEQLKHGGMPQAADFQPKYPSIKQIRETLSDGLDALLHRALAAESGDRYMDASELGTALKNLVLYARHSFQRTFAEQNLNLSQRTASPSYAVPGVRPAASAVSQKPRYWRLALPLALGLVLIAGVTGLIASGILKPMALLSPAKLSVPETETSISGIKPGGISSYYTRTITNSGGQPLKGDISCDTKWLHVDPMTIWIDPGETQLIKFYAETYNMAFDSTKAGNILIETNGGKAVLPVKMQIMKDPNSLITARLLYQDSLVTPTSDWKLSTNEEGGWSYEKGGLLGVLKGKKDWMRWLTVDRLGTIGDFIGEISVRTLEESPSSSSCGTIFRLKDKDNRLDCRLYDYGVNCKLKQKYRGVWKTLIDSPIAGTASKGTANRLRVDCTGAQITVYINDQKQGTAYTDLLSPGYIGVTIGTGGNEPYYSAAVFNDAKLYQR